MKTFVLGLQQYVNLKSIISMSPNHFQESYRNHKINKLMRKSLDHKLFQEWREYQQSLDNQIIPTQRFINIIFESRAVEEIKKYLKILQLKLFLLLSI